jgi:hypothetical protein
VGGRYRPGRAPAEFFLPQGETPLLQANLAKPPDHHGAGQGFHQAVQPEPHRGEAARQATPDQGGQALQEIVALREVGEKQGLPMQDGYG